MKWYTLAANTLAVFEFVGVFSNCGGSGSYTRVTSFISDRALLFPFLKRCNLKAKTSTNGKTVSVC